MKHKGTKENNFMKKEWKSKKGSIDDDHISSVFYTSDNSLDASVDNRFVINYTQGNQEVSLPFSTTKYIFESATSSNLKDANTSISDNVVHFILPFQEHLGTHHKMKHLLSFAYHVGSRSFNKAYYDLINAYAAGITIEDLDEISDMFIHHIQEGSIISEIGPWPIFDAYQMIRNLETRMSRDDVIRQLDNRFGDKFYNPDKKSVLERSNY
jgi:hypothetical protein